MHPNCRRWWDVGIGGRLFLAHRASTGGRGCLGGGLLILRQQRAPTLISVTTDGVSLPLDLMCIADDGTIMEVHTCISTDSTTPWVSTGPVSGALEVACG